MQHFKSTPRIAKIPTIRKCVPFLRKILRFLNREPNELLQNPKYTEIINSVAAAVQIFNKLLNNLKTITTGSGHILRRNLNKWTILNYC